MANLHYIKLISKQLKMPLKEIALRSGISEQAMQKILRTNSTSIETLENIAKTLGVSPEVFFRDAPPVFEFDIPSDMGKAYVNHASEILKRQSPIEKTKDEKIDIEDVEGSFNPGQNDTETIKRLTEIIDSQRKRIDELTDKIIAMASK